MEPVLCVTPILEIKLGVLNRWLEKKDMMVLIYRILPIEKNPASGRRMGSFIIAIVLDHAVVLCELF